MLGKEILFTTLFADFQFIDTKEILLHKMTDCDVDSLFDIYSNENFILKEILIRENIFILLI